MQRQKHFTENINRMHIISRDSAKRFQIIFDKHFEQIDQISVDVDYPGKFFLLENKKNVSWKDLVFQSRNGSFACTAPDSSNHGMPMRHVLACFREGFVSINAIVHFNTIYQKDFVCNLPPIEFTNCTAMTSFASNLTEITSLASWDFAFNTTEVEWRVLNNIDHVVSFDKFEADQPNIAITDNDSFSQRLKKAINYITPHCIEQSEYAKRIFDLQNDIEDDLKTKAQRKASKDLKVSEKIEGYVTVPSVTVAQQKTGKNVKRFKDNSETKKKSKN